MTYLYTHVNKLKNGRAGKGVELTCLDRQKRWQDDVTQWLYVSVDRRSVRVDGGRLIEML